MRRVALAVVLLSAAVALPALAPASRSSSLTSAQRVSWSPDGTWVAVKGMPEYGFGVAVARADGSAAKALSVQAYNAKWSPDGRRIADASGSSMVVETVADGSMSTVSPPNRTVDSFDWSPDAEQVVYSREGSLFVARWDGSGQTALTAGWRPAWSPDGREVAFVRWPSSSDCQSDIAIIGADGNGERTIASGPEGRIGPVWSPDGSRLAYVGGCSSVVYVVHRDGSGERVIGNVGRQSFYGQTPVAWSPDGRWLVVHRVWEEATMLFEVDGAGRASFATTPGANVTWSPRGDSILFSRVVDGERTFFVGSLDGSERAIVPGSAAGWSPDGTKIAVVRPLYFESLRYASCAEQLRIVDLSGRVLSGVTPCRFDGSGAADAIVGTPGPDSAFGFRGADRIFGGLGDDFLSGGDGGDRLYGGSGQDRVQAGSGSDRVAVRDGVGDRVACGPGRDVVWADSLDRVDGSCERVVRL